MSLPLEKATYRAIAIATTLDRSSQKNTKFIAVNFEIVDDEYYNGETPQAWKGYFTDKTEMRTVESLQHMGYQGDELSDFENLDREGCQRLLPNVVEIVCEPESFTGDDGNEHTVLKVQWVNRVGGGRFKASNPLDPSELKAFSAQMKSVFRNARGPQRSTQQRQQQHPNVPNGGGQSTRMNQSPGYNKDDSDIPF